MSFPHIMYQLLETCVTSFFKIHPANEMHVHTICIRYIYTGQYQHTRNVFGFFPIQYPPEKISIIILTFITFCL